VAAPGDAMLGLFAAPRGFPAAQSFGLHKDGETPDTRGDVRGFPTTNGARLTTVRQVVLTTV